MSALEDRIADVMRCGLVMRPAAEAALVAVEIVQLARAMVESGRVEQSTFDNLTEAELADLINTRIPGNQR